MLQPLELTGQTFTNLTALRPTGEKARHGLLWEFRCACGNIVIRPGSLVKIGMIKSCGCLIRQKAAAIVGQRFTRLVVKEIVGKNERRQLLCKCLCDCGNETVTKAVDLRSGHTQSCGCLMLELAKTQGAANLRKLNTTHGMSGPICSRDLTWVSWASMIQRTSNPKNNSWNDYGGRGIVPCEFIRATPVNLIALIGPRPSRTYSLDRKDNNRGYHCGQCTECVQKGFTLNVRWATKKQQNNNKRNIRMITIDGVTRSEQEWSELLKVSVGTIRNEYHYELPEIRRREPGIEFTYEI